MNKKILRRIMTIFFFASFLYYIYWIIDMVKVYFTGIETGWLISSLSSGRMVYGLEAVKEDWDIFIFTTLIFFWWIPLYEIIYEIVWFVKRKKENHAYIL